MTDNAPTPNPKRGAAISLDPSNADARFESIRQLPGGDRIHRAARSALAEMHSAAAELRAAMEATAGHGVRTQRPRPDSMSVGEDGSVRLKPGDIGSEHRGNLRVAPNGKIRAFSGREARLVDAARDRFAQVAKRVDSALAQIDEAEAAAAKSVGQSLIDPNANTPAGAIAAMEVRSYVRGLPGARKVDFLRQRVEGGDLATVAAVLGQSGFTTEMTADEIGVISDMAARKFAPDGVAVRDGARQAREMVQTAGRTFAKTWNESVASLGPGESEQNATIDTLAGGKAGAA